MPHHLNVVSPRSRGLFGAAFLALAAMQAPVALAQGRTTAAQAIPAPLLEVRKAWAAAVQKRNAPAAAALAAFPLQNEAYREAKTFGRASYLQSIDGWSTLKTCLSTERMERVKGRSRLGTYTFNCDGHGFYFAERDGQWRHTGYENTNE